MSKAPDDERARDRDTDLHARLLARDPTAPADLFEQYLEALTRVLLGSYPNVDEQLVQDAVADALFSYSERPEQFDPTRLQLSSYLRMSARGDLLNQLKQERRRQQRQIPLHDVEDSLGAGNMTATGADLASIALEDEESARAVQSALHRACRSDLERRILQLVIEGERHTEVFAKVLGIDGLGVVEQRREVKRVKERLLKRLRRAIGPSVERRL